MWNGWYCFGGTEIVNNGRAMGYARTAGCQVAWFKGKPSAHFPSYNEDQPYEWGNIEDAPWFDPDRPALSSEFLGVYAISVDGLDDNTRAADMQERVVDGAVIGRQREGGRLVRFRVVLTGTTARGREYGRAWLSAVLAESTCSSHEGGSCGTSDLRMLTTEPWPWDQQGPISLWRSQVDEEMRILHGVKEVTPLLKEQEFERPGSFGYIMEFTLGAEQPQLFGLPLMADYPTFGSTVVQDVPFNLITHPSAELGSGVAIISQNLSPNPSVETNAIGWVASADGVQVPIANITSARSLELAAVGAASFKVTFTAASANAVGGWFAAQQEVPLLANPTYKWRYSINIWGAGSNQTGSAVLGALEVEAVWLVGGVPTRTDALGTIVGGSGNVSVKGIAPPSGSTSVIVRVRQRVTSWAAGNVVRIYADALAVTNP